MASTMRVSRVTLSLAVLPLIAATFTLAGWFFTIPRLTDWDNDGIAQMPNNALCIAAAGIALACALYGRRRAAWVTASVCGAIAAATLFEHITGANLGIDTLLLEPRWGFRGLVAPGRMGVPASVSLVVVSASVVLFTFARTRRFAVAGGLFTIAVAMLSAIGYFFGADPLYSLPRLTSIALQTSVMLLLLGAALVAAVPEATPVRFVSGESSASLLVRNALPVIVLFPILLGWLRVRGQQAGLFDTAFGSALLVLAFIALLVALLLWSASAIDAHEEVVRQSRDRLAAILGSITDPFVTVDPHWNVAFVNDEARKLLGGELASLSSREPLRRALEQHTTADFEVFLDPRWYVVRAFPKANGGLAIHWRDVTERKAAEQAIRDSEEKFELLFRKAAFAAALARLPDGRFVDVNEAFVSLFGYSREEAIGRTSLELGIEPDPAVRTRFGEQLQGDGSVPDAELRLRRRNGDEVVVVGNTTRVEIGGEPFLLTMVQDITMRKAAEEALLRSADALRQADRMKDEFLATLSHELRTPLTSIVGWSQVLLLGALDKNEQQLALETIRSSARAQAQLIEDVLDVSRMISGKMRLERAETDLVAVVEAAVATVRPAAEAKRMTLQVAVEREIPHTFVDPDRIQQVVWNLLSNAIKFSPERSGVEIAVRNEDGAIAIEVADQGPGIAPDFLPHLFERFRQADSSTSRAYGGLGIGLALAKELVELHGGSIGVESRVGEGSRFTVRLPVTLAEPSAVVRRESAGTTSLDGVRVLYVDDRADARLLVSSMLEHYGATVVPAESVDDALGKLAGELPDVVVTDLAMPRRDGFELLATLRADTRFARLPVLALTAQRRVDDEGRAIAAGFRSFLRKPIDPHELAEAVAKAVR